LLRLIDGCSHEVNVRHPASMLFLDGGAPEARWSDWVVT
jgi:hypothetical protein